MTASPTRVSAALRKLADMLDNGMEDSVDLPDAARAEQTGKRTVSANLNLVSGFALDLAEIVADEVRARLDLDMEHAGQIGIRVSQRFCSEFAGQQPYIPFNIDAHISERDGELYQHYRANGRNAAATAKAFGMGLQNVYRRISMLETCYRHYLELGRNAKTTATLLEISVQAVLRRVEIIEKGKSADRQSALFDGT